MPIYTGIGRATTLVEGTGKQPTIVLEYGDTLVGSQEWHDKLTIAYTTTPILQRLTSGLTVDGTVDSVGIDFEFSLGYGVIQDWCLASAADVAVWPLLTAGNRYTAWGVVRFYDSAIAGSQYTFRITGDGLHGGPSTFTLGAKTMISGMTANADAVISASGSSIDCMAGTCVFDYTTAGATPISCQIEIVFDLLSKGNYATYGGALNVMTKAVMTIVRTFVTGTDISTYPAKYGFAVAGLVKTEKTFPTGSQIGDPAVLKTFYYGANSSTYYTPSCEYSEMSSVTAADLP